MLDRAIINHASPTLAGLKLGSLINLVTGEGFFEEFAGLSEELREKGVRLMILRLLSGKALVYVYRPLDLERILDDKEVQGFLAGCGYICFDTDSAIQTLRKRLNCSVASSQNTDSFPHEIGVFLGYPLEDVIGFIENGGRNCLSCGCWKVYANECAALKAFARFEKCKSVYQRLFASGCPLSRLTVAARSA